MQPGRKSAASLAIHPLPTRRRPKLTPPSTFTAAEQTLFNQLQADNPHLCASDEPLLRLYVMALSKATKLARSKDLSAWERACRMALTLATKMRITAQSTQDPQALGRRKADAGAAAAAAQWLQNGGEPPWSEAEESRGFRAGTGETDDDDEAG